MTPRRASRATVFSLLALSALLLAVGCGGEGEPSAPESVAKEPAVARRALRRGVDWLVDQQAADGGWHSTTYGAMHSGVGNTALVVEALSLLPADLRARHRAAIERGVEFLLGDLAESGHVRAPGGEADYPTYATALTLSALARIDPARWSAERRRMIAYLRGAQQTLERGWREEQLDFGGWHHTEADAPRTPGATNVSIARVVLAGLRAAAPTTRPGIAGTATDGIDATDETAAADALVPPARSAALLFLARCQNWNERSPARAAGGSAENAGAESGVDGGFFFTPAIDDPLNKAGTRPLPDGAAQARSYGTATADGALALLAAGVPVDDARLRAALDWLVDQGATDVVPGFTAEEASARDSLTFYYWATLARLADRLAPLSPAHPLVARRGAIAQTLVRRQQPDGSWRNPATLMREDDPLLATALAVAALALCEDRPTGRVESAAPAKTAR